MSQSCMETEGILKSRKVYLVGGVGVVWCEGCTHITQHLQTATVNNTSLLLGELEVFHHFLLVNSSTAQPCLFDR